MTGHATAHRDEMQNDDLTLMEEIMRLEACRPGELHARVIVKEGEFHDQANNVEKNNITYPLKIITLTKSTNIKYSLRACRVYHYDL
jgi:hypothetical protein